MRSTPNSRRNTRALGALTLGLVLVVSACGSDNSGDDPSRQLSATKHNNVDVAFATDMIKHHAQALSIVDLTVDRSLDPEVQQLAEDIRAKQVPEIETMTRWLTNWDEEVPETVRDHANAGHDMGDMRESMEDIEGMMTAEDMDALENASDAEFQTMWLEMMIEHHEGAIETAKVEQKDGQYKPAVDLARTIVESQTKQIETMKALLD